MSMKKKLKVIPVIMILSFIISCTKNSHYSDFIKINKKSSKEIKILTKNSTINIPIGEYIKAVFANDTRRGFLSFIIVRKQGLEILSLNIETKSIKQFPIIRGEGPGEFLKPRVLEITEEEYVLLDSMNPKITEFNRDFILKKSLRCLNIVGIRQMHEWALKGPRYNHIGPIVFLTFENMIKKDGGGTKGLFVTKIAELNSSTGKLGDTIYSTNTQWNEDKNAAYSD